MRKAFKHRGLKVLLLDKKKMQVLGGQDLVFPPSSLTSQLEFGRYAINVNNQTGAQTHKCMDTLRSSLKI